MTEQVFYLPIPQDTHKSQADWYGFFRYTIFTLYILQILQISYFIYKQCTIDIFFVDWEVQERSGRPDDNEYNSHIDKVRLSAWRMLFIANEYNELMTDRKINIEFVLLILGFFMQGFGYETYAYEYPSLAINDVDNIQKNLLLKFAITTSLYLLIGFLNLLIVKICSHWNELKSESFVDISRVSNITILMLQDYLHGYYIHSGDLKNTSRAEGNSSYLQKQINSDRKEGFSEENDFTFEILIPYWVRKKINQVIEQNTQQMKDKKLKSDIDKVQFMEEHRLQLSNKFKEIINIMQDRKKEVIIDIVDPLSKYLGIGFPQITEDFYKDEQDVDQQIKEAQLAQSKMEVSNLKESKFLLPKLIPKKINDYSVTMFGGNEMYLLTFNIFSFAVFDLIFNSTFIGIVGSYFMNFIIEYLRSYFGESNLSNKTKIEEQFLI